MSERYYHTALKTFVPFGFISTQFKDEFHHLIQQLVEKMIKTRFLYIAGFQSFMWENAW